MSARHSPPSSPYEGTETTLWTPETTRRAAASIRPGVEVVAIRHTTYLDHNLTPQPHTPPVFINEIDVGSDGFVSRYILIQSIPDGNHQIAAGSDHEIELSKVEEKMKEYAAFEMCVPIYSRGVYLRFDDIQDAGACKYILEQHDFKTSYVDNYTFALAKSQDTGAMDEFEGQIRVEIAVSRAVIDGDHHQAIFNLNDLKVLHQEIETALSRFGSVRDFVHTATHNMFFVFRVEFFSVEVANRTRASLLDRPLTRQEGIWTWTVARADNWTGPRAANSPHRRFPRVDDRGRFMEFRHAPLTNAPAAPPRNDEETRHNQVLRHRIVEGSDVRTTIMLRNIPNKLDWMTLKALLDRVCFGTYDFLYLRIDFRSGHNVGYAFVNFTDMSGMLAMLDQVEHRGWVGYRSNKNAELSYATIQGREALVQKFRNSSVMQQTPYCRPRLFLTKQDAWFHQTPRKIGMELKFPDPDNWSKFQRSIDSARTVGLFPPTGLVQQGSDRTHASTYDRGTPRDTVQSAVVAQFSGLLHDYDIVNRRVLERMFHERFGPAPSGVVAYENIPIRLADHLLADDDTPARGVVARPFQQHNAVAGSAYPRNAAAGPAYPRNAAAGPAYPRNTAAYYQADDEAAQPE